MRTWALKRLIAVRVWAQSGDAGQTSFEYLGIAVVIAVIIGVLAGTTDIGNAVLHGILGRIQAIIGAGG